MSSNLALQIVKLAQLLEAVTPESYQARRPFNFGFRQVRRQDDDLTNPASFRKFIFEIVNDETALLDCVSADSGWSAETNATVRLTVYYPMINTPSTSDDIGLANWCMASDSKTIQNILVHTSSRVNSQILHIGMPVVSVYATDSEAAKMEYDFEILRKE